MVLVQFNTKNAVQELVDAVESGQLSKDELDAKCRKVLMYKYMLGLRNRQPQLRVSGMSYRINTEEAQALAAKLRRSAVTVLNNISMSSRWHRWKVILPCSASERRRQMLPLWKL